MKSEELYAKEDLNTTNSGKERQVLTSLGLKLKNLVNIFMRNDYSGKEKQVMSLKLLKLQLQLTLFIRKSDHERSQTWMENEKQNNNVKIGTVGKL